MKPGARKAGGIRNGSGRALSAPKQIHGFGWSYLLVFVVGAGIIAALTGYHLGREYRNTRRYWEARLSVLADDRVWLVTKYLDDRREDAQLLAALPTFRTWLSLIAKNAQPTVPPSHHSFTDFLAAFNSVHHYPGVYILDPAGNILAGSPGAAPLDAEGSATCRRAAVEGVSLVSLSSGRAAARLLTFVAPIFAEGATQASRSVVGVAAILDDPSVSLIPALSAEAVPTRTGETLLVRREGGRIVYLSPLRQGTASPFGFPDLAAVIAVEGRETWGELVDYRGVQVLAATRPLPLVGWGLISKIDRDEALADFYRTARLEGFAAGLVVLALGGILVAYRRRQAASSLEERIAHQQDVLNERHYAQEIVDSIPAWLLVLSADLRILSANRSFLEHFKLRREEVEGRPLQEILRTEALPHRVSEAVHGRVTSQDVLLDVTVAGHEEKRPARITLADLVRMAEGAAQVLLVVEDLTESERLRGAAEQSEQRLRDMVESLDAIVWEADPATWQFSFVSRRAEEILGYPVEQWLTEPGFWVNHIHPDDRDWASALCQESSAHGKDHRFEYRALVADGRVIWLRDIVRVVVDEEGIPRQLRGLMVDVTERKEHEEALQASEDRYRDLVEHSRDLIGTHDLEGMILSANPAVARRAGYQGAQELVGRNVTDFLPAAVRHEFQDYLRAIVRDGRARGLMRVETPQGERIIEYDNSLRTEGLERPIVRCLGHDVTDSVRAQSALRASEERYRLLFERNLAGVYRSTLDGRIFECNDSFARILGYASRSELLARPAWDLYASAEDRETFVEALQAHKRLTNFECRLRRKDSTAVWVLENATLIEEKDGSAVIEGTLIDITDHKRTEETLRIGEERFRAQYKSLPVPTFSWQRVDDDFVLVEHNDAAVEFTRGDIASLIGRKATEVYRDSPEIVSDLSRCLFEKTPVKRSMVYRLRSTGETKLLDVTYSFVPPDLVMVHAQDAAQGKRAADALHDAERRFRPLGRQAPAVVYLCRNDARYRMLYITDSVERLTGYSQEDFLEDKISFVELYHPSDLPRIQSEVQRALAERRPFHASYRLQHRSGEWLLVDELAVGIREGGEVAYWEGILSDASGEGWPEVEIENAGSAKRPGAGKQSRENPHHISS